MLERMPVHTIFNLCEAVVWVTIAFTLAWRSSSAHPSLQRVGYVAAAAFFVFAGTDLIEAKTGAWYRPLGLLLYNAVCLTVIVYCYWQYRAIMRDTIVKPDTKVKELEIPETRSED